MKCKKTSVRFEDKTDFKIVLTQEILVIVPVHAARLWLMRTARVPDFARVEWPTTQGAEDIETAHLLRTYTLPRCWSQS